MNVSESAPREGVISLQTMPEEEYKAKLREGAENAQHMDGCKNRKTCPRCIQYKAEGYQQDWRTGLHYSPYERWSGNAPSLKLTA